MSIEQRIFELEVEDGDMPSVEQIALKRLAKANEAMVKAMNGKVVVDPEMVQPSPEKINQRMAEEWSQGWPGGCTI